MVKALLIEGQVWVTPLEYLTLEVKSQREGVDCVFILVVIRGVKLRRVKDVVELLVDDLRGVQEVVSTSKVEVTTLDLLE